MRVARDVTALRRSTAWGEQPDRHSLDTGAVAMAFATNVATHEWAESAPKHSPNRRDQIVRDRIRSRQRSKAATAVTAIVRNLDGPT